MVIHSFLIYGCIFLLMMIGLGIILLNDCRFKKLIGLSFFQASIIIFYLCVGFIHNSAVPILSAENSIYTNPVPHVLMLTAIVVGIATTAVGLALSIRIAKD